MDTVQDIIFGLVVGIVPALLWLWFWLKQDKKRPEPKGRLALTFLGGTLAFLVVLPFEELAWDRISDVATLFIVWACIEEVVKFIFVYFMALRRRECDEPIDPMIYMITGALGFSAIENVFFVIAALNETGAVGGFGAGNMRFIGATLLHVLASGTVGFFMSLSFYRRKTPKTIFLSIGIALAVFMHAYFNLGLEEGEGVGSVAVFSIVWLMLILLLLAFEKAKRIENPAPDSGGRS